MRGYSAIGLINTKTEANIGGALRACSCYGASFIATSGARYKKMSTDTLATWKHIPLFTAKDLREVIPFSCVPVAIEITQDAESLVNFVHPERAFYIFGPEDGSIPNEVLNWCKYKIQIPTKHCMNLASTVNVVLYDRLLKKELKFNK